MSTEPGPEDEGGVSKQKARFLGLCPFLYLSPYEISSSPPSSIALGSLFSDPEMLIALETYQFSQCQSICKFEQENEHSKKCSFGLQKSPKLYKLTEKTILSDKKMDSCFREQ